MPANKPTHRSAEWQPAHALLLMALLAASAGLPALRLWPLPWLMPLAGYALTVALVRPLRATFRPWQIGRVTRTSLVATLVIAVTSSAILAAFHTIAHPDVRPVAAFLPVSALGGIILTGILFSFLNALFEEIIFRGILFEAFASQWGAWMAVLSTGVLFGYGHLAGYPPGPLGAVLAGLYGLALGWLPVFTGGLAHPFLAHIVADATIFILIARSGVF